MREIPVAEKRASPGQCQTDTPQPKSFRNAKNYQVVWILPWIRKGVRHTVPSGWGGSGNSYIIRHKKSTIKNPSGSVRRYEDVSFPVLVLRAPEPPIPPLSRPPQRNPPRRRPSLGRPTPWPWHRPPGRNADAPRSILPLLHPCQVRSALAIGIGEIVRIPKK